jgi:hypothetical protein
LQKTAEARKLDRYRKHAPESLQEANEIMWKLDLNQSDLDQLTAQCQPLKFELDSPKALARLPQGLNLRSHFPFIFELRTPKISKSAAISAFLELFC